MSSTILVFFRNDLKVIIIGTLAGALLQVICAKYIKDHLEVFDRQNSTTSEPIIENPKIGLRRFSPRGVRCLKLSPLKLSLI